MKRYILLFLICAIVFSACKEQPEVKIGLVADPQYAYQPTKGKRQYKESLWKLTQAIDTFNMKKVDFVQTLGDVIDANWSSFDSILPVYKKLSPTIKSYHLLGNHDFSVGLNKQSEVLEKLKMHTPYYSYSRKNWMFIVLDATDYSYYTKDFRQIDSIEIDAYFKNTETENNRKIYNSAIGNEQIKWLKKELQKAKELNQKVILFSHLPIRPLKNSHNLWNDFEITSIIENYNNVVAFINGHNHAGNYEQINGVHYITLFAMVDSDLASFGVMELFENKLFLKGFGYQKTLVLDIIK